MPFIGIASLVAGVAISATSTAPHELPSVALNSVALFHIEQAILVIAAVVVASSLVAWPLKGRLPSQMSAAGASVSFSDTLTKGTIELATEVVADRKRVERLETHAAGQRHVQRFQSATNKKLFEMLDTMEGRIAILEKRPDPRSK